MAYWRTFQQNYLPYIPIFLLALSCGAGSGTLMTTSFFDSFDCLQKRGNPYYGDTVEKNCCLADCACHCYIFWYGGDYYSF